MDAKHTPTPWSIDPRFSHDIVGSDGKDVCTCIGAGRIATNGEDHSRSDEEADANASFVVRACNAHDGLTDAAWIALMWLTAENPVDRSETVKKLHEALIAAGVPGFAQAEGH